MWDRNNDCGGWWPDNIAQVLENPGYLPPTVAYQSRKSPKNTSNTSNCYVTQSCHPQLGGAIKRSFNTKSDTQRSIHNRPLVQRYPTNYPLPNITGYPSSGIRQLSANIRNTDCRQVQLPYQSLSSSSQPAACQTPSSLNRKKPVITIRTTTIENIPSDLNTAYNPTVGTSPHYNSRQLTRAGSRQQSCPLPTYEDSGACLRQKSNCSLWDASSDDESDSSLKWPKSNESFEQEMCPLPEKPQLYQSRQTPSPRTYDDFPVGSACPGKRDFHTYDRSSSPSRKILPKQQSWQTPSHQVYYGSPISSAYPIRRETPFQNYQKSPSPQGRKSANHPCGQTSSFPVYNDASAGTSCPLYKDSYNLAPTGGQHSSYHSHRQVAECLTPQHRPPLQKPYSVKEESKVSSFSSKPVCTEQPPCKEDNMQYSNQTFAAVEHLDCQLDQSNTMICSKCGGAKIPMFQACAGEPY